MLLDPPFAGRVTEWQPSDPDWNTLFFYVLAAARARARRLGPQAADAVRHRDARSHVRRAPCSRSAGSRGSPSRAWCFLPVAIGRKLERQGPAPAATRLNRSLALGALAVLDSPSPRRSAPRRVPGTSATGRATRSQAVARASSDPALARLRDRPSRRLAALEDPGAARAHRLRRALRALRAVVLRPPGRVPRRGGRRTGRRSPTATEIVVVDELRTSHTADFLEEPGARALYRDDKITVVLRPATSLARDPPSTRDAFGPERHDARRARGSPPRRSRAV